MGCGLTAFQIDRLLRNQVAGQRGCGGGRRRNRKRQPRIPARWPICRVEFPVCLQAQISLRVADGKDRAELRPHSENPRSESAEYRLLASVVRDLLIRISNETDKGLFRKKLRGAPVEVEVNSALNSGIGILEIVCKP